jgi:hypothetical protein
MVFYKAMVQAILLYRCEMWVLTLTMLKALTGFHHQVACQITGKVSWYLPQEGWWFYPPIEEALSDARLESTV